MEGMGVKFTPGMGRHLLIPFKHVWTYVWLALLGAMASPNSLNGGLACLRLPSPSRLPTHKHLKSVFLEIPNVTTWSVF